MFIFFILFVLGCCWSSLSSRLSWRIDKVMGCQFNKIGVSRTESGKVTSCIELLYRIVALCFVDRMDHGV